MVGVYAWKPTSSDYYASDSDGVHGEGGIDATASGPYCMEQQTLTIDYVRVPVMSVSSNICNLASGTADYEVEKTHLAIGVKASYSRRKVYGGFGNPTYQQPQKFQVNAISTDHLGNSYGALGAIAGVGTAMGPAGTIVTYQPWMQRRHWNDAFDTEVDRTMTGWLCFVPRDTCEGLLCMPQCNGRFMTDFPGHAVQNSDEGKFSKCQFITDAGQAHLKVFGDHYVLPGGYSTGQETAIAIYTLIDQMGSKVTNFDFLPEAQDEAFWPLPRNEGFAEYDISRHDYS